ncbi:S41 family peptidase [Flavobacterium sp. ACN6]|uniref:S41 family peptidase n=1 Tax=Flavobacterium sp. ACN6 TaxID=1920426 RepID=UPI000BB33E45|nr:S41 family peptidase [Flavobacterium sp. ACN6]PBJ12764.1 Peptidase family S41 [Flavobacterium sp. ACN6]
MSKLKWVLVFCACSFMTFGKNHSYKRIENLQIENLASLAKVWGFLKYYHPNVSKGNFNWDEQLIQIIPKVEQAHNKEELSNIYLEWIYSLGSIKECKSCKDVPKAVSFDKNFNLSWTQNSKIFTNELSQKLKYIEENRFQGSNFYVAASPQGNIVIKNEIEYPDFEYPNSNYRLLSLFRYWNTVEYFFPYKYMMDQKWDEVLMEMIPKFENAINATEYQLVMQETVVKLDDTHASFFSNKNFDFFGRKYIPAFVNVIEKKVAVVGLYNDSLAKINDIRIGDIIEEVDGKDALKIMEDRAKYVNGSNKNTKAKNYHYFIFNGSTDSVKVKLKRDNNFLAKKIKRYEEVKKYPEIHHIKEKFKIDENNIAYINLDNLEMKDQDVIMNKINSTKGLIIDIRNYPDFMAYLIARRLIKEDKVYAKLIKPDLTYPGKFIWKKPKILDPMKNHYYSGKVVLLVNEETQSMAEYTTMFMQTGDNVTTIGSQTAGADGDIARVEFLTFKTAMSGLGVFYPDGTETQRVGVKVDIVVRPTIKGIQEGKDEVLDAAKEFLNKK